MNLKSIISKVKVFSHKGLHATLYDSICMTSWKRQSYANTNQISSYSGLRRVEDCTQRGMKEFVIIKKFPILFVVV